MNKNLERKLIKKLQNPNKSNYEIIHNLKTTQNIFKVLNIDKIFEIAWKSSRLEVIEYLFDRGIDPKNLIFKDFVFYNPTLLQIFMNNISSDSIKKIRNLANETLLLKLAMNTKIRPKLKSCLKILVRHSDLEAVPGPNFTSIYYAYYRLVSFEFLTILFKRGASIKGGFPNTLTPLKHFCRNPRLNTNGRFLALKLVIDLEPNILEESRETNNTFGVELRKEKRTAMDYLMEEYSVLKKIKKMKEAKFISFLIAYVKQKGNKERSLIFKV